MRWKFSTDYSHWSVPLGFYYKHGIFGFGFLCWHGYVVSDAHDPWPRAIADPPVRPPDQTATTDHTTDSGTAGT